MGDCSDQLSVLKDWTSAHALDDAAGLFKKILILHPDHHAFVYIAVTQVDFFYLYRIFFYAAVNRAVDRSISRMHFLAVRCLYKRMAGQFLRHGI